MLATADTARTNKLRKIQRDADRFMSSPLSFSEAGDLARTHTHPITREPVAFAARSPAQLI